MNLAFLKILSPTYRFKQFPIGLSTNSIYITGFFPFEDLNEFLIIFYYFMNEPQRRQLN